MSCAVAVPNSPVFSSQSPFAPISPFSRVSNSRVSPFSDDVEQKDSTTILLKRKRPAKLSIPIMANSPAGFPAPATPFPAKEEEEERDGVYSVCCKRGRRPVMEDRFAARVDMNGDPKQAFFGIFDGHGGVKAAEFAAKNIEKNIMAEVETMEDENIEEAVKRGYLKTDSEFLEEEDTKGGSCCLTALITHGDLVVSNAGDCRAVICRGGVAEALTTDHRPSRLDEKDRIESMGGYIDCFNGVWRIQGSLAVSRAIGDKHLKQWVTSEPETKVVRISPKDEFLIMASDGLWDKVTNQEAIDVARPMCTGCDQLQPLAACKKLVDLAVSRGSLDDISVMAVILNHYLQ